ncbi:MAG TPA: hypothetical protein VFM61_09070 [Pseudidiomarina sp.]|nr:hypothetical protein [Pseudidiomarina sp.]
MNIAIVMSTVIFVTPSSFTVSKDIVNVNSMDPASIKVHQIRTPSKHTGLIFNDINQSGCFDQFEEASIDTILKIPKLTSLLAFKGMDTSNNGRFDSDDYGAKLYSIWFDKNGDRECQSDEIVKLSNLNFSIELNTIEEINLRASNADLKMTREAVMTVSHNAEISSGEYRLIEVEFDIR